MKRGENKHFEIRLNEPLHQYDYVKVSFRQGYKLILEKQFEIQKIDDFTIGFDLSQKETLLFYRGEAEMQVRVCEYPDDKTNVSNIMKFYVEDCLDAEVMTNEPQ